MNIEVGKYLKKARSFKCTGEALQIFWTLEIC